MTECTVEQAVNWLRDDDVYWLNRDIVQEKKK
ncbi:MAG: hypothetical protein H6Q73_4189 [Firmicutes bacterium]|nr:hypothetical protein [Bacillota bacterium]